MGKRKNIKTEYLVTSGKNCPSVSIIVPCFNEGTTVIATIDSILNLDYPKDRLKIIAVDDGSTDNTLKVLQIFKENPQVKIHHKENGGKYTALNFGIKNSDSDLLGCLDADSFVDKDALKNMLPYFEDEKIMAVVPSIKIYEPKNIIQKMQIIEYGWGIFARKVFSYLNALHVTPGPFTIFRRKVFENIGEYKHAHHTEDLEMALRMQKNNYKILNSHRSIVFTITPDNIKALYKQRRRWTYGFLKNVIDYKHMFFNKKYGNLGFFVLPFAIISVFTAIYFAIILIISNTNSLLQQIMKIRMVGFSFFKFNLDWFYLNTSLASIITIFSILTAISIILISIKLSEGKFRIRTGLFYYFFLYPLIAPLWLAGAVFNVFFSKTITWR